MICSRSLKATGGAGLTLVLPLNLGQGAAAVHERYQHSRAQRQGEHIAKPLGIAEGEQRLFIGANLDHLQGSQPGMRQNSHRQSSFHRRPAGNRALASA